MLSLRLIPSVVAAVVSRNGLAAVKTLRPQGDKDQGEDTQGHTHLQGESISKLSGPSHGLIFGEERTAMGGVSGSQVDLTNSI